MGYVFSDGQFYPEDAPAIFSNNRGFRFADGFFETIRVFNGKPLFLEHHFSRILDSLKAYQMDRPINFALQKIEREIIQLCDKNSVLQGGRVRITFTRKAGGFYLPTSRDFVYTIEAMAIPNNRFELNGEGLKVDIYPDIKKDVNKLSIYKNIDSKLYILAALYAQEKGLDDALIQNYKMGIIEGTSSNVFLVSNGVLYTSTLEDGPVAGIMRMQIINLALENNIKIYECTLSPQNLLAADELFLTNAVKGIQWVSSYRTKRYYNDMSQKLTDLLNETAGAMNTV
ncbi:MAG: aminotransferase class IV [Flavobacteriales bacterium]|nr:aminotransferase class IV [Flavobacteriales bacterium]